MCLDHDRSDLSVELLFEALQSLVKPVVGRSRLEIDFNVTSLCPFTQRLRLLLQRAAIGCESLL